MRNILKGYHEIIAISVTLSAGTGGTAVFTTSALGPVYTLSSLPIGTQIQLVQIQGVDTYVFLDKGSEIGSLTITAGSGYDFDSVKVNNTTVTSTAITLQDGDAIYVAFRVAEILLARNPSQGYEMVWDGVDSIGFKFSGVPGNSGGPYSGEIWIADTDYGMQPLNQLGLYPNIVPTEADRVRMAESGGNNLYAPGNITPQNTYTNDYWRGDIDFSTYNGTASMAWAGEHFVGLNEWIIIKNMFTMLNFWEDSGGTSLDSYTGVQIPGSNIMISPYSFVYYDNGNTNLSTDHFYYIPGDYYDNWDQSQFRCVTINDAQRQFPRNGHMELYLTNPNKDLNLGKMRVLNTTKTNYSLDS